VPYSWNTAGDDVEACLVTDDHAAPVLLYDGVCGFCNRSVQTILLAIGALDPG
jgi:hypothetical protein